MLRIDFGDFSPVNLQGGYAFFKDAPMALLKLYDWQKEGDIATETPFCSIKSNEETYCGVIKVKHNDFEGKYLLFVGYSAKGLLGMAVVYRLTREEKEARKTFQALRDGMQKR